MGVKSRRGGCTCARGWFPLLQGRNQHNIAKQLHANNNQFKNKQNKREDNYDFPSEAGALITGKSILHMENTVSNSFFVTMRMSAWQQGKSLTHQAKMGLAREPGRAEPLYWVSHSLNCLIYSYCLPILMSLIWEQTVAMLRRRQDGKIWQRVVIFCRSNMNFIHMYHSPNRVCCCCFCMKVSEVISLIFRLRW